MKRLAAIFLIACFGASPSAPRYPSPPTDATVDVYYGTSVPDPYRPLEDVDAPATRAWVEAEASLTRSYIDAIPERAAIRAHLQSIVNYERYGVPFHQLDAYFYTHNTGLQNQDVLFVRHGLHGSPRALIDPNVLSRDGSVAVGYEMPSWNAKLLAYSTQKSGSEWQTWHVRDVSTGGDLPDTVRWSRFSSAAWAPDDSGFVYERYPQPAAGKEFESALREHAVYFHRLGSAQNKDELIYYRPDHKNWLYEFKITDDRRFGILTVRTSDSKNTRIAYFDTTDPWRTVHELLWKNDAQWTFVGNAGAVFFFTTTQNAPNSKVVAVDVNHAGQPRTLVPEKPYQLQSAYNVGHRLILSYLVDARSLVRVYDEGGKFVREVDLPGIGAAAGFGGSREDRTTFYAFTGYTMPSRVYAYDLATGKSQVYYEARVDFDASHYVSKEVFYTSKDGTRVPMILSYRKGLALDGNNPTLLYGYGGFGIPQTPRYGGSIATWMQLGGIYAVPNIRGGSEYGEAWHRAGMLGKKQNVFDDFIAAAEYLIAQKYTSTPKLAIKGDSNGGLLIGAVETQRPELFGAAIPGVGLMDMLRYDKFTIGPFFTSEYGCSTCGADEFAWLYKYSPYQNLRPGTSYPPTLVLTSDHDDRVFPAHSFKFAAKMQADQAGSAPILLRVQLNAGHGESTTLVQTLDLIADTYAFLVKNLGMSVPERF